jgi:hypothetical protein
VSLGVALLRVIHAHTDEEVLETVLGELSTEMDNNVPTTKWKEEDIGTNFFGVIR